MPLIIGNQPPNVHPYFHPFVQKNEILKIIQELLEVDIIHPNTRNFSLSIFRALKNEGTWNMCPNFWDLNKLTIKDKFPIHFIDDLLDDLNGAKFFT